MKKGDKVLISANHPLSSWRGVEMIYIGQFNDFTFGEHDYLWRSRLSEEELQNGIVLCHPKNYEHCKDKTQFEVSWHIIFLPQYVNEVVEEKVCELCQQISNPDIHSGCDNSDNSLCNWYIKQDKELREKYPANIEGSKEFNEVNIEESENWQLGDKVLPFNDAQKQYVDRVMNQADLEVKKELMNAFKAGQVWQLQYTQSL